jgi:RNAse (barnase) inhibitor barstar
MEQTAKEKAQELVFKKFGCSKQYALTAVDEILNAIEQIFETFEERKYWQEVKQEIKTI